MDKDPLRLQDIATYGKAAVDLAESGNVNDIRDRLALERAMYLVGEAAAQLTPSTRKRFRQPWEDVIALRNLLAHRYEMVRPDRLVDLCRQYIPSLLAAIDADAGGRRSP